MNRKAFQTAKRTRRLGELRLMLQRCLADLFIGCCERRLKPVKCGIASHKDFP
jgi:hypothetical protein